MRLVAAVGMMVLLVVTLAVHAPARVDAQSADLCDRLAPEQFTDVDAGDYGAEYILCMRTLGLSLGRADGGYGPEAVLTRAEMASFLVRLWRDRLERSCPAGGTPFTDVAPDGPHAANINCLYNLGITRGATATTFGPGAELTAAQISRFLLRTYRKAGGACPSRSTEIATAVSCLAGLNVIPDTAEGRSGDTITRAQMAVYLVGLWHNMAGRGLPPTPPALERGGASASSDRAEEAARLAGDILEELVRASERPSGYDRGLFDHWSDLDGDGCDTRREVLIRDSRVQIDPGGACRVVSGLWYSHYDDEWVQDPSSLDIDHLVPLAEAWDSGAHSWSNRRREAFANDEGALVAVTARSNRSKGARDPAEWMPVNTGFACAYAGAWVAVKAKWSLSVDTREAGFLESLFTGDCAGTRLQIEMPVLAFPTLSIPDLEFPDLQTPALGTPGDPADAPPNPGDTKNCGDFRTQAAAQEWFDTYFPHYGDVARLDADGDGEACESLP